MYLEPIEQPKGLMARLAYWLTRRELGKVITPLKVTYARVPESFLLARAVRRFSERGIKLDPAIALLVQVHVAQINHCHFCIDIGRAFAHHKGMSMKKFGAVAEYATDPQFTERERAALAFAGEVAMNRAMRPETFARVREHFTEREIVEIAFLNAIEHYYNVLNISMGIESDGLCPIPVERPAARTRAMAG